jgi:hypothetical protein
MTDEQVKLLVEAIHRLSAATIPLGMFMVTAALIVRGALADIAKAIRSKNNQQ